MSNDSIAGSPIQNEARHAATTKVAFFDLSDRTQIEVTGSDRARFLHSFTSNDIKRLKPGEGCETFLTNLKGKVVAHVFVFCHENSFWLDGTPGQLDTITAHLRKFVLIDDVQFHPRNAERGELYVSGPLAAQLLQLDGALSVGGHIQRETENRTIDFRRVDLLGVPGFLLSISANQIDEVKQGLEAVGVVEGSRIVRGFADRRWVSAVWAGHYRRSSGARGGTNKSVYFIQQGLLPGAGNNRATGCAGAYESRVTPTPI